MQQGIKKLQWFEYLKVVFLKMLNLLLCRVLANQVTNNVLKRQCTGIVHTMHTLNVAVYVMLQ